LRVGVQFADQRVAVLFSSGGKMGDEGLDQFPAGAAESGGAAEVGGIGFYEIGIEVVLADEKAELIPEPRLAISGTIGRKNGRSTARKQQPV
jgi:hypothetical protein